MRSGITALLKWLWVSHIHCGLEGPPADRIRIIGVDNRTMVDVLQVLNEGIGLHIAMWREQFLGLPHEADRIAARNHLCVCKSAACLLAAIVFALAAWFVLPAFILIAVGFSAIGFYRFLNWLFVCYTLTEKTLQVSTGILFRRTDNLELFA